MVYVDLNGQFLISAILITAGIGAAVNAGINAVSQGINIARGKQEKFNFGALGGSFIEGAVVAGVSAIPGVGAIAVGAASAVGGGINSALTQYGDRDKIDWGQVMEDTIISGAVGGIAYKVNTVRNAAKGKTMTPQEISANAKTRDVRKVAADEIEAAGKKLSGLRRRTDALLAAKHRELLKKYAKSQIVKKSEELVAGQLEYEINTYVIKGHASITGYIKDMLRQFLPIETGSYLCDKTEVKDKIYRKEFLKKTRSVEFSQITDV